MATFAKRVSVYDPAVAYGDNQPGGNDGVLWDRRIRFVLPGEVANAGETPDAAESKWDAASDVASFAPRALANNAETIYPGKYEVDSSGGAFGLTISNNDGIYEFCDPGKSLGTNTVTLTAENPTDTFSDENGLAVPGPYILNVDGAHVVLSKRGTHYSVIDTSIASPDPTFTPQGGWDPSGGGGGNPDLTNVATHVVAHQYEVSAAGTADIGFGPTLFAPGDEVWRGADGFWHHRAYNPPVPQYNLLTDLPDPTLVRVGTFALVLNDPTPANNRLYISTGTLNGATSTTWDSVA